MDNADETKAPEPRQRRSPALLATVVALPVAVIVCFAVFLVLAQQKEGELRATAEAGHLKSVSAPAAGEPACGKLLAAIPAELGVFRRDDTTEPTGFARWTSDKAGAVEVRCGTDRPADLTNTSKLQVVNGVQWLQSTPAGAPAPNGGAYWVAVDHRPYVALWVPDSAGTAAIQAVSDAIRANLQAASLDLGR
ncbi:MULTISPECIES: DUF3515 domain-containing protein [Tsukamurella]|uniref:DUF3515 domain-containing protein n=1 Tax=Tsukamurella strandjordii TaxID=147577 RepID=A0AA90NH89_9ACTN|nr:MULTISPECIES: DUF3515 domain-containing protein [Tsukamurella]MDP0399043.1 DUF3515 domain-containing protein [Tsukamurella strandjordii]GIZ95904.1 hypothetical protein TTY48_05160 [Tsukamurella sp. TY48]